MTEVLSKSASNEEIERANAQAYVEYVKQGSFHGSAEYRVNSEEAKLEYLQKEQSLPEERVVIHSKETGRSEYLLKEQSLSDLQVSNRSSEECNVSVTAHSLKTISQK